MPYWCGRPDNDVTNAASAALLLCLRSHPASVGVAQPAWVHHSTGFGLFYYTHLVCLSVYLSVCLLLSPPHSLSVSASVPSVSVSWVSPCAWGWRSPVTRNTKLQTASASLIICKLPSVFWKKKTDFYQHLYLPYKALRNKKIQKNN